MAGTRVSIDAMADELRKQLEEYGDLAADEMKAAVKEAGKSAKQEIRTTAPKRTGVYAKDWAVKTTAESSNKISVTVHSKKKYRLTHLLEHGHAKRGGGRVRAIPHIGQAQEKAVEQLERDIAKGLGG